jgi:branched-chain amino acid transport system ATP-binding protein
VKAADRVALGLVRTFQITEIFPDLSVFENVRIGVEAQARCSARPWPSRGLIRQIDGRVDELLETTGLTPRADRTVSELAHGDQRVVEVTMALSRQPRLLLDEPSQGLAPLLVRDVFRVVASMRAEGISILLVEQNARFGLEVADRVYVLSDGKVVHAGTAQDLARDQTRVRALAGAGASDD